MAMEPMPKIVFLSHSSHENLTRDWANTFALFSTKTKCYPCHRMHYTWEHCMRNEEKGVYWEGTATLEHDSRRNPDQETSPSCPCLAGGSSNSCGTRFQGCLTTLWMILILRTWLALTPR